VRMSVLVEDLLELARLDQGRPLAFAELDLEHLVTVAVDDARVAAPDHPITTSLAPVRITGDADRLAQVVLNLLSNATTHTPPGTAVQVQLTADETGALLVVQDNGPGLPPGVEEKVFERFWRADPSRTRDSGGTGLGLSIVSAIVAAHGGTVRAASAAGAIFTVHLPFIPPDPPAEEPADATDQPGDVTR